MIHTCHYTTTLFIVGCCHRVVKGGEVHVCVCEYISIMLCNAHEIKEGIKRESYFAQMKKGSGLFSFFSQANGLRWQVRMQMWLDGGGGNIVSPDHTY